MKMKKLKWIFAVAIMVMVISCTEKEVNTSEQKAEEVVTQEPESIADIAIPENIETDVVEEKIEKVETKPTPKKERPKPTKKDTPKPVPAPEPPKKQDVPVKTTPVKPTKGTSQPIENKNNTPKEVLKEDAKKTKPKTDTKKAGSLSHAAFNGLLSIYVNSNGAVNYSGFKSKENQLGDYLKKLADNPVESSWSRNEKLAYWINLYNAGTIKLILENYPVNSIQDINSGKPWDKRWIKSGDKTYTLNEIENSVIRPQFNEPLIHFAVNCAAKSCPRLMNKAFTESNVNSLMRQNAKWFIGNSNFNKISQNKIEVSKIFDWYGKDFGNLISYLSKNSNTKINSDATVTFMEYDWDLNKQ
jgi:hypothetical protein